MLWTGKCHDMLWLWPVAQSSFETLPLQLSENSVYTASYTILVADASFQTQSFSPSNCDTVSFPSVPSEAVVNV